MEVLFYFLICIAATALGAIAGIGGGVIIKPVLDSTGEFSVSTISFMSGCTVLAMSIVSLLRSRKEDTKVEPRRGTLLAFGGAAGGAIGKVLFDSAKTFFQNDGLIGIIQNIIMILLTVGVIIYIFKKNHIKTINVQNSAICLIIGLFLGIISSFLGIGGGPINLVFLYYFFSMDAKTAALNSIYIIFFSQTTSLISAIICNRIPEYSTAILISMVSGGILGGYVGRAINKSMSNYQVDTLFRWLLVTIAIICCYNLVRYSALI